MAPSCVAAFDWETVALALPAIGLSRACLFTSAPGRQDSLKVRYSELAGTTSRQHGLYHAVCTWGRRYTRKLIVSCVTD